MRLAEVERYMRREGKTDDRDGSGDAGRGEGQEPRSGRVRGPQESVLWRP